MARRQRQMCIRDSPYSYQKKAMAALTEHAFSTEAFPINPKLLRLVQVERRDQDLWGEQEDPQIHKLILSMQTRVLNHLLNAKTLYRLSDTGLYGNTYSVDEMIGDLTKATLVVIQKIKFRQLDGIFK